MRHGSRGGADAPPLFAQAPLGGYELFEEHDDGSWWSMLTPGASGWALMAHGVLPSWGYGRPHYAGYGDTRDGEGVWQPYVLPAVVSWRAVFGPGHTLGAWTSDFEFSDVLAPVGIGTDVVGVGDGGTSVLMSLDQPDDQWLGVDEPLAIPGIGDIVGLAPVFSLTPIAPASAHELAAYLQSEVYSHSADMLGMDPDWFYEEDDPHLAEWFQDEAKHRFDGESTMCSCGKPATTAQWYERVVSDENTFDPYTYLPPGAWSLWNYTIERFITGWSVVNNRRDKDTWCSSFWQYSSPWSGSARPGDELTAWSPRSNAPGRSSPGSLMEQVAS